MQPQQPQPDFNFILQPQQAPKKAPLGGNSMATRLLIVLGGVFVLVIIAAVVMNLLGNAGAAFDKAAMLKVTQDQTELLRLSTLGSQEAKTSSNKNFSATAQLSLKTDQATLLSFMAARKYTPKDKELALGQNPRSDAALQAAQSSSTFDAVYKDLMKTQLASYQNDLKAAYNSGNDSTKQQLSTLYDHADLLAKQLAASN